MLSKKMAVSLMSLITILAFAFVAPAAYSAFDVDSISAVDVSEAGDTQIEYGDITITIKFKEVVDDNTTGGTFALADITAMTYNKFGAVIANGINPTAIADANATAPNGKDYTLTFAAIAAVADNDATNPTKLVVSIAKDAVEKAGDSANKNNAKSATFFFVGPEPGTEGATVDPTVVSITRSTPIGSTIASAFIQETVTTTFTVKIVLSEKPKDAFGTGSLDVKGGTVNSVVAGVPFAASSASTLSL